MRTIIQNIYKFDELTPSAQKVAIYTYRGILVDGHCWWDIIEEDAKELAQLKITAFDLSYDIASKFITNPRSSAQNIICELPSHSNLYTIAANFLSKLDSLEHQEDTSKIETDIQNAEDDYKSHLENYYSKVLEEEYNYLISDEAISDHLLANDFEFYEDGMIFKS
jgi:gamma-glutamylcyclotransferase (GGCT)/AIG2-like uncharacterized protein YtfP